jgi:hypothetical protein
MDFKLSINGGFRAEISEDFHEEDIIKLLEFDENDIESLLKTHAAVQVYWEALAIRYKNRYEIFKEEWAKKWWAYNRTYAKYVLTAYGEKTPTVEAIKDTTILIYSSDTSEAERIKYGALAYSVASRNVAYYAGGEKEFYELMYKHILSEVPWYFESVIETLTMYKEQYELIENVAEKMNSRSFHMQSLLSLLSAKQYNIGPRSISDGQMADEIQRRRK